MSSSRRGSSYWNVFFFKFDIFAIIDILSIVIFLSILITQPKLYPGPFHQLLSNFPVLSNVIYHENKPLVNPYKKAYDEAFIPIIISTLSVKIYYADQLKGHHFLLWIWAKIICYSVELPWIIWHEWNIRYSGKMSKNTYTWRLLTGSLGEGNSKAQYLYYLVFLQRLFRSTGIPKHLVLVLQC